MSDGRGCGRACGFLKDHALFGSIVREQSTPRSDIDVLGRLDGPTDARRL